MQIEQLQHSQIAKADNLSNQDQEMTCEDLKPIKLFSAFPVLNTIMSRRQRQNKLSFPSYQAQIKIERPRSVDTTKETAYDSENGSPSLQ